MPKSMPDTLTWAEFLLPLPSGEAVEGDADKLQDAPSQDEQVPDKVHILPLGLVEHDPCRVGYAASRQEGQAQGRQGGDNGPHGQDHQPAHQGVKGQRDLVETLEVDGVEDDAHHRQGGVGQKQHPAGAAPHHQQGHGHVGPQDQDENGAVVHDPQGPLYLRVPDAVVDRRGGIQQD